MTQTMSFVCAKGKLDRTSNCIKALISAFFVAVLASFYVDTSKLIALQFNTNILTFQDCSTSRSHTVTEESPFWSESERFMNLTGRARKGIRILLNHTQPSGLIVDMGAGFHALERYIPEGTSYRPVDLVQRVDGIPTSVCNLNKNEFPFFNGERIAAYFFLGSFEYVLDKVSVLRLCRKRQSPVILQYHVNTGTQGEIQWVAPFSMSSLKETAELVGYRMRAYDALGANQLDENKPFTGLAYLYLEPV